MVKLTIFCIINLLVLFGCGGEILDQESLLRDSHEAQVSNEERNIITNTNYYYSTEEGNSKLKGFSESDELSSLTQQSVSEELSSEIIEKLKSMRQSDEPAFKYEPLDGRQAEFSEPVMVTSASLRLADIENPFEAAKNDCQTADYFPKEPTLKEVFNLAVKNKQCGLISYQFCIRTWFADDKSNNKFYMYLKSPYISVDIPCSEKTFRRTSFNLLPGPSFGSTDLLDIQVNSNDLISKALVSNKANCSETQEWIDLDSEKKIRNWKIRWDANHRTIVYAKFMDIFGNESGCISESLTDLTPPGDAKIEINSGADRVSKTNVFLTLQASEALDMYLTNAKDCASGGKWEVFDNAKPWILSSENEDVSVFAKFRDRAGNESTCVSDTIIHDNTAPDGASVSINSDATHTNSKAVSLTLNASDAVSMYLTNQAGCLEGGKWEEFTSTKSWELLQENAVASVFVKFKDQIGNESSCVSASIIHDNKSPENPTIVISGGGYTNQSTNDLVLSASFGPSEMYLTNTADCTSGGVWETYETSKNGWLLAQTNQIATVYAKFKDIAGNESACVSDTIVHDNIAPASPGIAVGSGAYTQSVSNPLTLTAGDNPSQMYITNTAGCGSGGTWETYSTNKSNWSLAQTNATNNVYVKFRDLAGNQTACVSDSIIHDTIAPSSPAVVIGTGSYTKIFVNTLYPSAAGGPADMYITNTSGCGSGGTWETYSTTRSGWSLSGAQANSTATVYIKFRDKAGNISSCVSDSIIHDNIPPASPGISINSGNIYTDTTSVSLALSASGADELYLTNQSGCSSGGSWETYTTSKSWTTNPLNAEATVYVIYRDLAGNESACTSDNIHMTMETCTTAERNATLAGGLVVDGGNRVICTRSQFEELGTTSSGWAAGLTYILKDRILLSGSTFAGLGTSSSSSRFSAKLKGNGYHIYGYRRIQNTSINGFINYGGSGNGLNSNLHLIGVDVTGSGAGVMSGTSTPFNQTYVSGVFKPTGGAASVFGWVNSGSDYLRNNHTFIDIYSTGAYVIGGFATYFRQKSKIENSYSQGTIWASSGVPAGGLIGSSAGYGPNTIKDSFTLVKSLGSENFGALVGSDEAGLAPTNFQWSPTLSGANICATDVTGGVDCTLTSALSPLDFNSTSTAPMNSASWNFTTIWRNTYGASPPQLRVEKSSQGLTSGTCSTAENAAAVGNLIVDDGKKVICNAAQLAALRNSPTDSYILKNNIDLTNEGLWASIANFSGTLDGNKYRIINPSIKGTGRTLVGFFDLLSGTVKNLGIEGAVILEANSSSTSAASGILAGKANGALISSSYVHGKIYSNHSETKTYAAGGFIGAVEGSTVIEDSYADIENFSNARYSGGFVARVVNSSIKRSYAMGYVRFDPAITVDGSERISGFVSYLSGATSFIRNSFASVKVYARNVAATGKSGFGGDVVSSAVLANNAFDSVVSGQSDPCQPSSCAGGVSTESNATNLFNTSHAVFTSGSYPWDFTAKWYSVSDYFPRLLMIAP